MPFDGSGNFNRVMNWQSDRDASIKIRADRHDQEDDNFASGLSLTLTKDGQSQPTADIAWNGKKITNLGAPTNPTDAATKGYADSIRNFNTPIILSGAGLQSRIQFPTPDISFGGVGSADPRFVWNDKADMSGTDIMLLRPGGALSVLGTILAGSTITATSTLAVKRSTSASNAHLFFYRENGTTENSLIYSTPDGALVFRVGAGANSLVMSAAGQLSLPGSLTTGGNLTAGQNFISSTGIAILAAQGSYVSLRPNGTSSGVGEVRITADGNMTVDGDVIADGEVSATVLRQGNASVSNGNVFGTALTAVVLSALAGTVFLRPNGSQNATGQATVNNAGNFQISSANAYKTTAGDWLAASDERIKEVVGDYEAGLAEIVQLQPRRYVYKGNDTLNEPGFDPANPDAPVVDVGEQTAPYPDSPHYQMAVDGTEVAGFIAQEIEAVMPDTIQQGTGYIDGQEVADFRIIDTTNLTYAMVNAIKELATRVEQLEAAA